jgi:TPR repeat protein
MKLWKTTVALVLGGVSLSAGAENALAKAEPDAQNAPAAKVKMDTADSKAGVDAWMQGDYSKAVAIWRPLADAGDADAQYDLGQAYRLGRGVPVDLTTALDYYRKAALAGHARAQDSYGLLLFQQNRRDEAIPYLLKAADRGEPNAQYLVGTALYNGDISPGDKVRAYALMTRAAASGMAAAQTSLKTMDEYIPENMRKQGRDLAAQMAQSQAAASLSGQQADMPQAAIPKGPSAPTVAKPATMAAAPKVEPQPSPTPVAAPAKKTETPGATGNWRVQLGAFSTEDRATALWATLAKQVSGLAAYQPYYVKGGNIIRLQAGPLASQADAAKLCATLKSAKVDCIPRQM